MWTRYTQRDWIVEIKFPVKEHRRVLDNIYQMIDSALTRAESESEDASLIQKDGVVVRTFIPSMTQYVLKLFVKILKLIHFLHLAFFIKQYNVQKSMLEPAKR